MIEKLIENYNQRSGLKIAVGKEKSPKPLETLRILDLVPVTGLEPVRCRQRRILSPIRRPMRYNDYGQYPDTYRMLLNFLGYSLRIVQKIYLDICKHMFYNRKHRNERVIYLDGKTVRLYTSFLV